MKDQVIDRWRVQQEGHNVAGNPVFVIVGENSAIAKVYTALEDQQPGRARRNADLIASAPELKAQRDELLDALKDLLYVVNKWGIESDSPMWSEAYDAAHIAAREAIAKVEAGK